MADIIGTNTDDIIDGGADNDLIIGGEGNDVITGGAGSDRISGDGDTGDGSGGGTGEGTSVAGSPYYGGTVFTLLKNDDGSYTRLALSYDDALEDDDGADDLNIDLANLSTTSTNGADTDKAFDGQVLNFYSASGQDFSMFTPGSETVAFQNEAGELFWFNGGIVLNEVGSGTFAGGEHYTTWADGLDGTQDGKIDVDILMANHTDYGIYKFLDGGENVQGIQRLDEDYLAIKRADGSYVAVDESLSVLRPYDDDDGTRDYIIELDNIVADLRQTGYRDGWHIESTSGQDFTMDSVSKDTMLVKYEDGRMFIMPSNLASVDRFQADGSLAGYWDGDQTIDIDGLQFNTGSTFGVYELKSGTGQEFEVVFGSSASSVLDQDYLIKFADGRIYAAADGSGLNFDTTDSGGADGVFDVDDIEDAPTTLWHKFVDTTGQDFDVVALSGDDYLISRADGTKYVIDSSELGSYGGADSGTDGNVIDVEWISNNLSAGPSLEVVQISGLGDGGAGGGSGGSGSANGNFNDMIYGGEGDDIIDGNQGDDTIEGGVGDDSIDGGSDNDTIYGGEGNDVINGDKSVQAIPADLEGAPLILWKIKPQGDIDAGTTAMTFDVVSGPTVHDVEGISDANAWYVNLDHPTIENLKIDGVEATGATRGGSVVLADGTTTADNSFTAVFAVEENGETNYYVTFGSQKAVDYLPASTAWDDIQATGGSPMQIVFDGTNNYASTTVGRLVDGVEVNSGSADYFLINANEEPNAMIIDAVDNPGADILFGGEGDDTVSGNQGDDVVYGGEGNDTLEGGADKDTIYGGAGDDTIIGDTGVETIPDDFAGEPLVLWELSPQTALDASSTTATFDVVSGPQLHDVEGISDANAWYVNIDHPTIENLKFDGVEATGATRGGSVVLADGTTAEGPSFSAVFAVEVDGQTKYYATFGTQKSIDYTDTSTVWDEIQASGGSPTQVIFDGTNNYASTTVGNLFDGAEVNSGSADYFFISANDEPDAMTLDLMDYPSDDVIYGGDGNDTISANQGDDEIYGGNGNDIIDGDEGNDTIYGDRGANVPTDPPAMDGLVLFEVVPQTPITGTSTSATFDVVSGPEVHDISGLDNSPDYWYVNGTDATNTNLGIDGNEATGAVRGGNTYLANGELASGGNSTAIFAVDVDGVTKYYATFGNQKYIDYEPSLTAYDDILDSGQAPSQIVYNSSVVQTLVDGSEVESGSASYYFVDPATEPGILAITTADAPGDDIISGGAGDDTIYGGAGNDTIEGHGDDDTIYGNADDDTIDGGAGNDIIYGDNETIEQPDTSTFTGDPIVMWEVQPQGTIVDGMTDMTFDVVTGPQILDIGGLNDNSNGAWYVNETDPQWTNLSFNGNEALGAARGGDVVLADGTVVDGIDTANGLTAVFRVEIDGVEKYFASFGSQEGVDHDASWTAIDEIKASGASPTQIIFDSTNFVTAQSVPFPLDSLVNGQQVASGSPGFFFIDAENDPDILDLTSPNSESGNDTITGGDGVDEIYGGAGDDAITVGDGDTAKGGDDRDTFTIDASQIGDGSGSITVDGGTDTTSGDEADDYDVLELSGVQIVDGTLNETVDADGNSTSGTVDVTDGTNTYTINFNEIEEFVPCFTADTMIDTENGRVRAADIKVGDMVHTLDNGLQPVLWAGSRKYTGGKLMAQPKLRPVRIKAGALAAGVPANDLIVSPQHRVLVSSKLANRMFGEAEILVTAKKLVMLEGIDYIDAFDGVEYIHFLCPQHEIVFSDGAPTETLYTGREALKALPMEAQEEIFAIFPELETMDADTLPTPARTILSGRQTRKFVMRHVQNNRGILEV